MKNKLIFLLALTVCLAAMPLGAGAYYTEITDLSDDFGEGGYSINGGELEAHTSLQDFALLSNTVPGTTYFLPLTAKDFEWENDERGRITMSTIEEMNIELDVYYDKGDIAFDAVKLAEQNGKTGILVDFVDVWPVIEEQDYIVKCTLTIDRQEYEGCEFKIKGTLTNRAVHVGTYDTACTLGVGRYAFGYDNVKNVKFNLGAGVTVTSDIGFSDKYYGAAVCKPEDGDEAVLEKHPQIRYVYQLETIGLKGNVRIAVPGDEVRYIYDSTLVYLGTTNDAVAFRTKYFVSNSKL